MTDKINGFEKPNVAGGLTLPELEVRRRDRAAGAVHENVPEEAILANARLVAGLTPG